MQTTIVGVMLKMKKSCVLKKTVWTTYVKDSKVNFYARHRRRRRRHCHHRR